MQAFITRPLPFSRLQPFLLFFSGSVLFALLLCLPAFSGAAERRVDLATLKGVINPVAAEFLTKAVDRATADGSEALIIQLDTPGGLDASMREIVVKILGAEIPVIVYVAPSGGRAASAGVFITLAAHTAAMAPGTNIGAAHPVGLGGGQMDKEMAQKVTNDAAAYIRSIAEKRGRNADWAEEAVRRSVSITESEALKRKVIDFVAPDLPALLEGLHGRKVETTKGERALQTRGATVREIEMGIRLTFLNIISDPNVAYLLMILGFYGLFFELSSPGAIFPGVFGGISLILAFYAFQTIPINYAGLLLILLAIILFLAEIKVVSGGVLTIGGIISMLLGSTMLIDSEAAPFLRISWSVILPVVLLTVIFFAGLVAMAIKAQVEKSTLGQEGLLLETGEALTDIAPEGQVMVHGETWSAESDEAINKGERVRVVKLDGLRLKVKRA